MMYGFSVNQIGFYENGLVDKVDFVDAAICSYINGWILSSGRDAIIIDNAEYVWINYDHMMQEIPMMHIKTKNSISLRMENLEKLGLISKKKVGDKLYVRPSGRLTSIMTFRKDEVVSTLKCTGKKVVSTLKCTGREVGDELNVSPSERLTSITTYRKDEVVSTLKCTGKESPVHFKVDSPVHFKVDSPVHFKVDILDNYDKGIKDYVAGESKTLSPEEQSLELGGVVVPLPKVTAADLTKTYYALHLERFHEPRVERWGVDGGMFKTLLKQKSPEKVKAALTEYMTSDKTFYVEAGFPLNLFFRDFDALLAKTTGGTKSTPVASTATPASVDPTAPKKGDKRTQNYKVDNLDFDGVDAEQVWNEQMQLWLLSKKGHDKLEAHKKARAAKVKADRQKEEDTRIDKENESAISIEDLQPTGTGEEK